ncbi:hypothetical protein [Streptomyces sp. NPDC001480]|uniref:caspase, EACC1-associated type n=1 Tax=Streptomyces sp. NPDC001480 TaxID=3364577 RepID=UPI0036B932E6
MTKPVEPPAVSSPTTALASSGARVLLIGTGTHQGPTLTSVPAVPRTVAALADALVEHCGTAPERLHTLLDPADARTMALAIAEAAQEAESTLLVYYVGHGLIGPGDELYLAACATDRLTPGLAAHQALPFSALREALTLCRAASVIVVLDCCFSGRARLGAGVPQPAAFSLPAGHGMYLMGSAERLALAPEDAEYTALSGELIGLLKEGDPRAPRLLTLDDVYDHLFRALRASGGPLPRRQAGDRSGGLVMAVNASAPAPAEPDGTPAPEPAPGPCPYPGLEAFTVDDAGFFHGRAELVEELLRASSRAVDEGRPLAVVGPSGAGKTSLLHAGLLAALRSGSPLLPGSAAWPCVVMSPGEHPVRSLAAALRPDGTAEAAPPPEDPRTAAEWVRDLVPEGERRLVLVVDQLEELFTACRSRSEQTAFLSALAAMAEAGTLVVAALRADFYGHAQALPELASVLRDHQVLVGPMRQEELRAAIERPAAAVGLELDEGLADLLIHELGAARPAQSQTGTLPLLSHALWATWRQRRGSRLTVAGYRASGGIDQAIRRTADETYALLDDAGRAAVRRMLPRLVRIDDEAPDTSRPVDRSELLDGLPDPQAAERALHALAAARLLVLDERTVRISHNALLTAWPSLREWIDTDRDWLRTRQQVAVDADAWWQAGKDTSLLYRGARLTAARERLGVTDPDAGWGGAGGAEYADARLEPRLTEFLHRSWLQERRAGRIRTAVIACLCVLTLLAGTGGVLAWVSGQREADQRRHAVARLVAVEAEHLRTNRPELAKQLSLVANRLDPRTATAPMLASLELPGVFNADTPAKDISLNADGDILAISTGSDVVLWDTVHGKKYVDPIGQMSTGAVALSPDGRLMAVVRESGKVGGRPELWDVTSPEHPRRVQLPERQTVKTLSLAISRDGHTLALGRVDGRIQLWDITDRSAPRALHTLSGHTGNVDSLAFAPTGHLLASAGSDGKVRLWDTSDRRRASALAALPGLKTDSHTYDLIDKPLHRVAFSPDGRLLAGPGDGNKIGVRLWKTRGRAQPTPAGTAKEEWASSCSTGLASASFSPDGKILATGCGSDTSLWDVIRHGLQKSGPLKGADGDTGPVLFAPRGHRVLRATTHGVLLWYVENSATPTAAASFGQTPSGFQTTARFSGGARRLLVIHGANGGALWDLSGSALLHKSLAHLPGSGDIGAEAAAFSPDGRILALSELSGGKHVVRLRDTSRRGAPVIGTITDVANGVEDISFSADGHLLAVADNNDHTTVVTEPPSVRVFDITTVSHPRQTASMKGDVFFVAFAPKNHLLVANTSDKLLAWTVSNPRHPVAQPTQWLTRGALVSRTAFSPDGSLLAATDTKDTTRLWRIEDGRITGDPVVIRTIGSDGSIAFSPDGRTLAWGSTGNLNSIDGQTNGHIELWDVSTPKAPDYQGAFAYGSGSFTGFGSLSYSSGTKPLLAAAGSTVDVWSTKPSDLTYILCKSIGDEITRPEWKTYVPGEPYDPPCR